MQVNSDQCTGCRICEMICSLKHSSKMNKERSRIRIESHWPEEEHIYVCRNCKNPQCIAVCPQNALGQNKDGIIEIDEVKCNLCQECVDACPFNAIYVGKEKQLLVCDTCNDNYECVQWCPNQALSKGETGNER